MRTSDESKGCAGDGFMEVSTCCRPRSGPDEEPTAATGHTFASLVSTTIRPQASQIGCREGLRLPGTRRMVTETSTTQVQNGFRAASANAATEGSRIVVRLTMGRAAHLPK